MTAVWDVRPVVPLDDDVSDTVAGYALGWMTNPRTGEAWPYIVDEAAMPGAEIYVREAQFRAIAPHELTGRAPAWVAADDADRCHGHTRDGRRCRVTNQHGHTNLVDGFCETHRPTIEAERDPSLCRGLTKEQTDPATGYVTPSRPCRNKGKPEFGGFCHVHQHQQGRADA